MDRFNKALLRDGVSLFAGPPERTDKGCSGDSPAWEDTPEWPQFRLSTRISTSMT